MFQLVHAGTNHDRGRYVGWVIVSRSTAGNRFGFTSAFGVVVAILGGALILGFKTLLEKFGGDIEY